MTVQVMEESVQSNGFASVGLRNRAGGVHEYVYGCVPPVVVARMCTQESLQTNTVSGVSTASGVRSTTSVPRTGGHRKAPCASTE